MKYDTTEKYREALEEMAVYEITTDFMRNMTTRLDLIFGPDSFTVCKEEGNGIYNVFSDAAIYYADIEEVQDQDQDPIQLWEEANIYGDKTWVMTEKHLDNFMEENEEDIIALIEEEKTGQLFVDIEEGQAMFHFSKFKQCSSTELCLFESDNCEWDIEDQDTDDFFRLIEDDEGTQEKFRDYINSHDFESYGKIMEEIGQADFYEELEDLHFSECLSYNWGNLEANFWEQYKEKKDDWSTYEYEQEMMEEQSRIDWENEENRYK